MSLPIPELAWAFSLNNVAGNATTVLQTTQDFFFKLKNVLVTLGCPVAGSSNGTTAGNNDNVDRWVTSTDIVKTGSWSVIKIPELGAGAAILIDAVYGNDSYMQVTFSSTGFGASKGGSNGTASAAPTGAVNTTWAPLGFSSYNLIPGSAGNYTFHVMKADNGCLRIICTDGGTYTSRLFIEKVKNPHSSWAVPIMTSAASWGAATWIPSYLSSSAYPWRSKIGGTLLSLQPTGEGTTSDGFNLCSSAPYAASDDGSDWPMMPIGIACATVGHRNWRKGQIYDMWWGSYSVSTGDTYPSTPSQLRRFIQFGQLILPWDGINVIDGTAIDMS
jgi:hypothetical protein